MMCRTIPDFSFDAKGHDEEESWMAWRNKFPSLEMKWKEVRLTYRLRIVTKYPFYGTRNVSNRLDCRQEKGWTVQKQSQRNPNWERVAKKSEIKSVFSLPRAHCCQAHIIKASLLDDVWEEIVEWCITGTIMRELQSGHRYYTGEMRPEVIIANEEEEGCNYKGVLNALSPPLIDSKIIDKFLESWSTGNSPSLSTNCLIGNATRGFCMENYEPHWHFRVMKRQM